MKNVMKIVIIAVMSCLFVGNAFAKETEIKGRDAEAIIKALRDAHVEGQGGEDSLSIKTGPISCDIRPTSSACTIQLGTHLREPLTIKDRTIDQEIYSSFSGGLLHADPSSPQCDGQICILSISGVDCEGSNDDKPATCMVDE